jgi:hypothetical protein
VTHVFVPRAARASTRAVVGHEEGESSIEEVPQTEPTGEEMLIAVDRIPSSVTGCRLYRGREIAHRDVVDRRLRDGGIRLFGHELCGTVAAVGDAVTRFRPGDRVYPPGKTSRGRTADRRERSPTGEEAVSASALPSRLPSPLPPGRRGLEEIAVETPGPRIGGASLGRLLRFDGHGSGTEPGRTRRSPPGPMDPAGRARLSATDK